MGLPARMRDSRMTGLRNALVCQFRRQQSINNDGHSKITTTDD